MNEFTTVYQDLARAPFGELQSILGAKVLQPDHDTSCRNRIFNQWRTFWLFLFQVLSATQSCREALKKAQVWLYISCNKAISSSTSAYCQARSRIKQSYLNKVHKEVIKSFENTVSQCHLWLGKRVYIVDGSSVSMPDTKKNQSHYPQPKAQKKGCGFPVMRIVALFSLATGALITFKNGSLNNHERTLWHAMDEEFESGDVLLADRGFCSFADFYKLLQKGVDSVMRLHQRRSKRLTILKKLGKDDWLVEWEKSEICPTWLSREEWQNIPSSLIVRHVRIHVNIHGFRSKNIILATTLLDYKTFSKEALRDLYLKRWRAEIFLRDLKTSMRMAVLRCKTPELIYKELTIFMIAYNCVRALIWESAMKKNIDPYRISFKGTFETIIHWAATITFLTKSTQKKTLLASSLI
jgi:hypothetical protein